MSAPLAIIFLLAALLLAALEAFALAKRSFKLELIAKPGVMLVLFFWLYLSTGLDGALFWFGLGILFSLAGDIFLMVSVDRFFLAGLIAFLFAHIFYIVGFNSPLPEFSNWGVLLAVVIALGGARMLRPILKALPARKQTRMRLPVIVYSIVISIMLLSAMLKIMDATWGAGTNSSPPSKTDASTTSPPITSDRSP
jgi:uncharacterized membrane protein YhhN